MAGMQIPGEADGSGYDKFRILRDQAQQRLRRMDAESRLQEVIQKQRTPSAVAKTATSGSDASPKAGAVGPYARAAAAENPDPKSPLGQLLDILA